MLDRVAVILDRHGAARRLAEARRPAPSLSARSRTASRRLRGIDPKPFGLAVRARSRGRRNPIVALLFGGFGSADTRPRTWPSPSGLTCGAAMPNSWCSPSAWSSCIRLRFGGRAVEIPAKRVVQRRNVTDSRGPGAMRSASAANSRSRAPRSSVKRSSSRNPASCSDAIGGARRLRPRPGPRGAQSPPRDRLRPARHRSSRDSARAAAESAGSRPRNGTDRGRSLARALPVPAHRRPEAYAALLDAVD